MGRHTIWSNRRVSIWAIAIIDAACFVCARVGFQTQSSRLGGQPGQQVHWVQMSESSPMPGGDQAHIQARMRVDFLAARCCWAAFQKQYVFGLGLTDRLGLLK